MATIVTYRGRLRRIDFSLSADGPRRSVRLGKVSQRDADGVKVHVERLIAAKITGHALPNDTAAWLAELGVKLSDRLANAGLIPKRDASTLGAFIDGYIKARADVKPGTAITYANVRRCLVAHFGADKPLREITPGGADAFRLWLMTKGRAAKKEAQTVEEDDAKRGKLADNTTRRRIGIARQFFRVAVRRGLIPANPFDGLAASVRSNPNRFRFVTRAEADAILAACPNNQWRLLFALVRFGGLRCPSEPLGLRWTDIDWSRNRITVHSSKTEHHPGGASRTIPLFPKLAPHLHRVFDEAEPGCEFVITRYRDATQNLRTAFAKIIRRAGVEPWPKLFVNLRATRAIELRQEGFPDHVVNAWLGHTAATAAAFYLRVTEADFERAAARPEKSQQKGQQSARADDELAVTAPEAERPNTWEKGREVTHGALCASGVTDNGWAILD